MELLKNKVQAIAFDTPLEEIADLIGLFRDAERDLKEARASVESLLLARLEAGPQREVVIGHSRWYARTKQTVKPTSLMAVTEAVLDAVTGDVQQFSDTLASDAFKPGYCRKLLGDAFDDVFETRDVLHLERGEVRPIRELVNVDTRFIR